MPWLAVGPKHKVSTASVIKEPRHIASVKKLKNSNYGSTQVVKIF